MTLRSWLVLFGAVACAILTFWWWMGRPIAMPPGPLAAGEKLPCVSYAPFRRGQTPFDASFVASPQQIDDDFARLAAITDCVRTYAVDQGLERAPELARKHGLHMILGIWLGRDPAANALQIEGGVALANKYPDVVRLVVVGNEAILRGEISEQNLAAAIRSVKARIKAPVTYAEVWEFWMRHKTLADEVDVVTVHILPYWEDEPVAAEQAGAHVEIIRKIVGQAFAGHPILIGETGWPSEGRMRWGARPSPADQARVLHDLVARAKANGFDVNYIEAFDQPWKRYAEGTVGGHWGLLDADSRAPKFVWGQPVSNHPDWLKRALVGIVLAAGIVAAAARAVRRPAGVREAAAVALLALVAGGAFGIALQMWISGVRDMAEAALAAVTLALAILAPVAAAAGIVRAEAPVRLDRLFRRREEGSALGWWLGLALAGTLVMALQFSLGLAFDPRYREFPAASLAGAVLGVGLALAMGQDCDRRGAAELVFAIALALCALGIAFQERVWLNFEAAAFVAVIVSLAGILAAVRPSRAPAAAG